MTTWHWADLSTVAKPPAPIAAGDPFCYGVVVCPDGGFDHIASGGCNIQIGRVVYRRLANPSGYTGDVIELNLDGQWFSNDLCSASALKGASPQADYNPTAYVSMPNGQAVATVNYIATSAVCQLSLTENGWTWADISAAASPEAWPSAGRPFGYWDPGNAVDRVVYRGTPPNDHEIYELSRKQNQSWSCNNLMTNDKSEAPAPAATGNPFGYYWNGVPRVIYRGVDSHIYEMHPDPFWKWANLSTNDQQQPPAPAAAGDPSAYIASDGLARVLYRGTNGHIHEMRPSPFWKWDDMSVNAKGEAPAPQAAGEPFGYTTFDGVPRVVYRSVNGHIIEIRSDSSTQHQWAWADLSSFAKATAASQLAAGDPWAYQTGDGTARVVYRGASNQICELALF